MLQAECIRRIVEPKVQITAPTVFLAKMGYHTLEMLIRTERRIVVEAKLNGAAYDGVGIDETVCLCHNTPIDAAGLVVGGCTMVFCSIGHDVYLVLRKPLPQIHVSANNPGRHLMMMLTAFAKARIVVGGNGIHHIDVNFQLLCQLHTLPYHHQNMVALVGFVETVIPRYDVLLDVLPESWSDGFRHLYLLDSLESVLGISQNLNVRSSYFTRY